MRRMLVRCLPALLVVPIVIGACQPAAQAPAVDTAGITAAIDSVGKAMSAAVAARDTDAVAALYADDAWVLPANEPRADGKEAIRKEWIGFLSIPGLEMTITSTGMKIADAGDQVVEAGTYQMKFLGAKSKPMTDTGKFVTVYRKVDGRWKIVVDTWNSDMPMPGM